MIVRELAVGIGCVLRKLHAVVCMADLNTVTLNGGVICRHTCITIDDYLYR